VDPVGKRLMGDGGQIILIMVVSMGLNVDTRDL